MRHLGVKLHGVQAPRGVLHARNGAVSRMRYDGEPLGHAGDHIVMAHPYGGVGHPVKQGGGLEERLNARVFAHGSLFDLAAQHVGHKLHAVANAKHGHAQLKHAFKTPASVRRVNAVRAAGEYHAGKPVALYALYGAHRREQLRVHALLANSSCDQPVVLGAEVQYHYPFHNNVLSLDRGSFPRKLWGYFTPYRGANQEKI